ncbi:M48 family metallopeptidase [Endozoicomonas sp. Mp262]|uniref:M48 family metallopeptidase n=1 Tax=Endozoicomonas sp. Mp262 TaxID=2919499 RepID=UPI0021E026E4
MKKWCKVIGLALGLLVSGCQSVSTTSSGAVGIERQQNMFTLLSEKQVNSMAREAYQETVKQAQKAKKLNQDSMTVQRLHRIADRLIAQVGNFRPDARNWQWEINLIADKQLNAYCMPGGKIMFFSGIIDQLKLTDDEIAAIMGHEMAHALREHGREAMSEAYAVKLGRNALQAVFGVESQSLQLADMVVNYALTLPHSRTKEVEADLMGLELMARAGYDPGAAVSLWKKMAKAGGQQVPEFMSTHPSYDTRISGLEASVHKVDHLYKRSKGR